MPANNTCTLAGELVFTSSERRSSRGSGGRHIVGALRGLMVTPPARTARARTCQRVAVTFVKGIT